MTTCRRISLDQLIDPVICQVENLSLVSLSFSQESVIIPDEEAVV